MMAAGTDKDGGSMLKAWFRQMLAALRAAPRATCIGGIAAVLLIWLVLEIRHPGPGYFWEYCIRQAKPSARSFYFFLVRDLGIPVENILNSIFITSFIVLCVSGAFYRIRRELLIREVYKGNEPFKRFRGKPIIDIDDKKYSRYFIERYVHYKERHFKWGFPSLVICIVTLTILHYLP